MQIEALVVVDSYYSSVFTLPFLDIVDVYKSYSKRKQKCGCCLDWCFLERYGPQNHGQVSIPNN